MNRILNLSTACAFAIGLCPPTNAQTTAWLRHFDSPSSVKAGTAYFTERVPRDYAMITFLAKPVAEPKPETSDPNAPFAQSFEVLGSSVPYEGKTILIEFPADAVRTAGGPYRPDGTFETSRIGPKGLRLGATFAVLATSPLEKQHSVLYAAAPVSTDRLAGKGVGDVPFLKTVLQEFAKKRLDDSQELQWFFGDFVGRNASIASLAFATRRPEDEALGDEAHRLAQETGGEKRICLDFLSGRLGTAQGFEPFFADLAADPAAAEGAMDRLRILAGALTYGEPRFDLAYILRGVPPTRSNKEMLDFALTFEKQPKTLAFLTLFVQFEGRDLGLDKDQMIRAYLATDRGMTLADRHQIYENISDYFASIAGGDATPENMRLTMQYPDGLEYPGAPNYTEEEWKAAVDAYWGIKRPNRP